jgi:phage shock protein B
MSEPVFICALLISAAIILGPFWLTYRFVIQWRSFGKLNADEAHSVTQLNVALARMESRIATLEHILDAEVPAWRSRDEFFRRAG